MDTAAPSSGGAQLAVCAAASFDALREALNNAASGLRSKHEPSCVSRKRLSFSKDAYRDQAKRQASPLVSELFRGSLAEAKKPLSLQATDTPDQPRRCLRYA